MTIESPCVNICVIDEVTRLCVGCGRTIEQIASWRTLSAAERRRIMDDLARRRQPQQTAQE